uniref:Uncharacterized protein n=1 Tax=Triticum urartu TaxID=4572 RepID=A0A8R7QSL4_TRIUA
MSPASAVRATHADSKATPTCSTTSHTTLASPPTTQPLVRAATQSNCVRHPCSTSPAFATPCPATVPPRMCGQSRRGLRGRRRHYGELSRGWINRAEVPLQVSLTRKLCWELAHPYLTEVDLNGLKGTTVKSGWELKFKLAQPLAANAL